MRKDIRHIVFSRNYEVTKYYVLKTYYITIYSDPFIVVNRFEICSFIQY